MANPSWRSRPRQEAPLTDCDDVPQRYLRAPHLHFVICRCQWQRRAVGVTRFSLIPTRVITFNSFQSDVSDCQSFGLTSSSSVIVSCGLELDVDCSAAFRARAAACWMSNEGAARWDGNKLPGQRKRGDGELADRSAAFSDRFNPSSELANQMKPLEKLAPPLVIYRKNHHKTIWWVCKLSLLSL